MGTHSSNAQIQLHYPQLDRMCKAILNVWARLTYRTLLSGSDYGQGSALFLNETMEKDKTTNNSKYGTPFSEFYIIVLCFINQQSFRQEKQHIKMLFVSLSGYKATFNLLNPSGFFTYHQV